MIKAIDMEERRVKFTSDLPVDYCWGNASTRANMINEISKDLSNIIADKIIGLGDLMSFTEQPYDLTTTVSIDCYILTFSELCDGLRAGHDQGFNNGRDSIDDRSKAKLRILGASDE